MTHYKFHQVIPGRETYIADWWPLLDEAGAK